jgi:hypothetical protein
MPAPVIHILPVATVVRKRLLPVDGQIIVKLDQKVTASDTIGETIVNRKHVIIDVAAKLKLSPKKADAAVKVKRGQKVAKNEIVAESGGLLAQEVTSPVNGRVVVMGGGKIVLETGGSSLELKAGLSGTVTEIIPNRGVVIRAVGGLVQGVWGNGRVDTGVMISLLDKPEDVLEPSRLDVSLRGAILLAGYASDAAVIKAAGDLPVRGLVLSSISPTAIGAAAQANFPILVLEGFGKRPMAANTFKLLSTNVKREVSILADMDQQNGSRPELVISLPIAQEPPIPRDDEAFAPGQTVRICSLVRPSLVGTLLQLRPGNSILPSGVSAPAAEVRLESGEQVLVPLTNLEVLG